MMAVRFQKFAKVLPSLRDGVVSLDEIQEVLVDHGYSADGRKGWLKQMLTQLETDQRLRATRERQEIIEAIKIILRNHHRAPPIADDLS